MTRLVLLTTSRPSAPAWRNCAGSARGRRLPKATCSGTRRRNAPEACAGRLQRLAQGWDGSANPVQPAARSRGGLRVWAWAACAETHSGGPFNSLGAKRRKRLLLGTRSHKRIGRLRPSISTPFAQQPGTPEPPGTPPQPPPDPTAPPPYEEPPRPIPIPRPDEPPVVDDPPPRRNA